MYILQVSIPKYQVLVSKLECLACQSTHKRTNIAAAKCLAGLINKMDHGTNNLSCHGNTWVDLGTLGLTWEHLGWLGNTSVCMGMLGLAWVPLGLLGSLGGLGFLGWMARVGLGLLVDKFLGCLLYNILQPIWQVKTWTTYFNI